MPTQKTLKRRDYRAIFGGLHVLVYWRSLVTLVSHAFGIPTGEKADPGLHYLNPVLCENHLFLFVFIFQLFRMCWCQTRVITCKESECLLFLLTQQRNIHMFYNHGSKRIDHILTSTEFALKNTERKSWGLHFGKAKERHGSCKASLTSTDLLALSQVIRGL